MQFFGILLIFIGLCFFLAVIVFYVFWRKIPLLYVAYIIVFGKRKNPNSIGPYIKKEGWHFFIDYLSIYTFELIKIIKIKQEISLKNVRCRQETETGENDDPRSGGELSIKIELIWQPDYIHDEGKRLYYYLESGGKENVSKIIEGMIEEDVRQLGREKSWEEFTFGTDELVQRLVKKLTGEEPQTDEELKGLLSEMSTNGIPDIVDLGIIILRFNIAEIKEQGELAKAAEAVAKEVQDRRAETFELKTETLLAEEILDYWKRTNQKDKTPDDALKEVRRRKAIREGHGKVFDVSGLDQILEKILTRR